MALLRLRDKDYWDIEPWDVYVRTIMVLAVCVVVFLFGLLIGGTDNTRSDEIERNEYAAEFNALPEEVRLAAAPFIKYEIPEGETTLDMVPVSDEFGTQLLGALPTIIGLFLAAFSVTTFFSYWYQKRHYYFLADLPLHTFYGWVLLVSMFVAWPLLAISAIRMAVFKYAHFTKKEIATIAEDLEFEEHFYEKPTSPAAQRRMRKARAKYINYRVNGRQKAIMHECKELEERERQEREKLQRMGEQIKAQQRLIGETLAERQRLSSVKVTEKETQEKAAAEWEVITQMRGVSFIYPKKCSHRHLEVPALTIHVKVRVPYQKNLYDFGDYQVTIRSDGFCCERIRSGVKADASSHAPDYNERSGFCFGSRKSTIQDYVRNGRLLEAITLIIDSLHSVNDEYAERQIPDCFRKVATVKRKESNDG